MAHALGRDLDEVAVNGRKGIVGARDKKEIALLSVRTDGWLPKRKPRLYRMQDVPEL